MLSITTRMRIVLFICECSVLSITTRKRIVLFICECSVLSITTRRKVVTPLGPSATSMSTVTLSNTPM